MGEMGPTEFRRLLDQRLETNDASERAAIDDEIRRRWEHPRAVLISDMSGFSRITKESGILHFLGLIRHMHRLCYPVIATHGGHLVKAVADNLYARFDAPTDALRAAFGMHETCARACAGLGKNDTVELGIGIAHGPLLDLDGDDFFGDPVNIASKLGEDLAEGSDVLATADAAAGFATPAGWCATPRRARISNVDIEFVAFTRG